MYHYRLYNKHNVHMNDCSVSDYESAVTIMEASPDDKVFLVEDDGHEILCGLAWIEDLLDNTEFGVEAEQ